MVTPQRRQAFVALGDAIADQAAEPFTAFWTEKVRAVGAVWAAGGDPAATITEWPTNIQEAWEKQAYAVALRAGVEGYKYADFFLSDAAAKANFDFHVSVDPNNTYSGSDNLLAERLKAPIAAWVAETSKYETATSAKLIQEIMNRIGVKSKIKTDGERTVKQLAEQFVQEGITSVTSRANMLARTYTNWAQNEGAMARYADAGVELMEWAATVDDATRPHHAALDGVVIPLGKTFYKKGEAYAVGDSSRQVKFDIKHPPLEPNCRCVLIPVIDPDFVPNDKKVPKTVEIEEPKEQIAVPVAPKPKIAPAPKVKKPKLQPLTAVTDITPSPEKQKKEIPTAPKPKPEPVAVVKPAESIKPKKVKAKPTIMVAQKPKPIEPIKLAEAKPLNLKPTEWVDLSKDKAGFPDAGELGGLKKLKDLGGSTGAVLVQDPKTGLKYVMKKGKNKEHIETEALADEIYQLFGANVPDFKLYPGAGESVKLSRYLEDAVPLSDLKGDALARAKAELKKHYAADAFVRNWDVVGLGMDNVLVQPDGKVWRIDNGGSFHYRAQGGLKDDDNGGLGEFWSMRKEGSAGKVFGDLRFDDVMAQSKTLQDKIPDAIKLARARGNPNVADFMERRGVMVKDLNEMHTQIRVEDKWKENYTSDVLRHYSGLQSRGVFDQLEGLELKQDPGDYRYNVKDKNGRLYDHMRRQYGDRDDNNVSAKYYEYLEGDVKGGNPYYIDEWASDQASNSGWPGPIAQNYFIMNQRENVKFDDFYWYGKQEGTVKTIFEKQIKEGGTNMQNPERYGAQQYQETMSSFHALSWGSLRKTEFKYNNREKGTLSTLRTEHVSVLDKAGLRTGESGVYKRSVTASASVFESYSLNGSELTQAEVPHHRVFGHYMLARPGGGKLFAGEHENEFLTIFDKVKTTRVGNASALKAPSIPKATVKGTPLSKPKKGAASKPTPAATLPTYNPEKPIGVKGNFPTPPDVFIETNFKKFEASKGKPKYDSSTLASKFGSNKWVDAEPEKIKHIEAMLAKSGWDAKAKIWYLTKILGFT